jgi:signal transduction histidine kinase
MTSRVRGTLARYGLAAGAVVAVSLLRLPLHHLNWPEAPYLLFAVAVLVAAGFGGFGPGLLAVSLSVIAGNFFFALPYFRFDFQTPTQQGRAVVFLIDGIFISILGGRLRTARQREEAAAREARTLQAEILEIAERERDRFGHDLHDGLGQHLTGTALMAGALARRLQGSEDRDSANRIASLLDEAVEQTRDLARGLAPMSLRIGGLPAAIEELGASAQRLFGVPCETECDPTIEVSDEDIAIHLYRVAQEAITNAAKHGGSTVRVALRSMDGLIELEVRDHGVGFDPNTRGYEGVGLHIMAYRAQRAGAKLIIESTPNQGTSVRCTLAKGGGRV